MDTYQVIKFVKIHFLSNWTTQVLPDAVVRYTAAGKENRLIVVAEGDSGLWSYDFSLKSRQIVYVIGDIVHIPSKLTNKTNGNTFGN
jgi:hypothetical protein